VKSPTDQLTLSHVINWNGGFSFLFCKSAAICFFFFCHSVGNGNSNAINGIHPKLPAIVLVTQNWLWEGDEQAGLGKWVAGESSQSTILYSHVKGKVGQRARREPCHCHKHYGRMGMGRVVAYDPCHCRHYSLPSLGIVYLSLRKRYGSRVPVTHTCNPSYSGGRDQEVRSQPRANSSQDPILNK
jgi:hypothetical protein